MVIDGQQRLTTVSLLLEAIARRLGDTEPVDGFSARKLRNYYLLDPEEAAIAVSSCCLPRPTRTPCSR